jgi:recombination protein RecR
MNLPSKHLEEAVEQMASLPGIGRKTALRLVLHLLKKEDEDVLRFSNAFIRLKEEIKSCNICHNLSDSEICPVCSNPSRSSEVICVVEDIRDILAIENTSQFKGKYHVLGGIISPMDGIGPSDLHIDSLVERVAKDEVSEVILALSATMEGETTAYFLYRKLAPYNKIISAIARGIALGDELQYADEITLGRSITQRQPFETTLSR